MVKEQEDNSGTPPARIEIAEIAETKDCQNLKAGSLCLKCKVNFLDYDGMLNLVCAKCGVMDSGGFT